MSDKRILKPCPFCGSKRAHVDEYDGDPQCPYSSYSVICGKCDASTKVYSTGKAAINAWNKRTATEEDEE